MSEILRSAIPTWIGGIQVVCLSYDIRGRNARLIVLDDPSNPNGRLVTLNIGDRAKIGSVDWELVSVDPVRTVDIPTGEIPVPGTSKATITIKPVIDDSASD